MEKDDAEKVLKELYDGPSGDHYARETTAHKIIQVGYYYPTLFKDALAYARKCKLCQTTVGRETKLEIMLWHVTISYPFTQWGLNIISEITTNSSKKHNYILTTTDYFTQRMWSQTISFIHSRFYFMLLNSCFSIVICFEYFHFHFCLLA